MKEPNSPYFKNSLRRENASDTISKEERKKVGNIESPRHILIQAVHIDARSTDKEKENTQTDLFSILDKGISLADPAKVLVVDFYTSSSQAERDKIKTGGQESYAISPVDARDKATYKLKDCVGLVVVGTDDVLGVSVSLLSHQSPSFLFQSEYSESRFKEHLASRMRELVDRCDSKTVEGVIFGGKYMEGESLVHKRNYRKDYDRMVGLLKTITMNSTEVEPKIAKKSKTYHGWEDVYFCNKERKLYIIEFGEPTPRSKDHRKE
ncbi:MAG: hypothetical protein COV07_01645 [Candidatus Vogelbacteria bacterium CG10_big_fil_rev_8_21_14_0_10_45_14]|uniref:Uncharacterized protein n=1 Tax=Candidatus Vogelbacteria bacterium CG10_big_fil_rev_8_21_14_0_10_45_14 TaxID=1975042 RepID=A0A2H0RKC7_9BACT|nr:MAG: hypothetical protein COV07_01645 [Candidatus Vogelbacteria bacterium CG10_big_fil_rev_8_21_14_0_10_45_14]